MNYASAVVHGVRTTVRNPFAVVLVSVATTISLVPVVSGLALAGAAGGLVGLWTTSFALGFVAAGGARIATAVVEREVSLGTDYFWEGIRDARNMGPIIGLGTFAVALVTFLLTASPYGGLVGMSLWLVALYLVLAWFVFATFALALWASFDDPREVRHAFIDGGGLVLEQPAAAGWFLVQAVGWSLLAIPFVIAPMLLLPGFLQVIGVSIVRMALTEEANADAARITGSK